MKIATTTTRKTEITADPDLPLVRIIREFGAPREKVFRAHTDPDLVGHGRTRLTVTSLVDSFEGRDAFIASGMEGGVRESYERLDVLLAR